MSQIKLFKYQQSLSLESGSTLPGFQLAYQTFGQLNRDRSNVVWIIHALTANSDPTEWWPGVVGKGLAIDPAKHFIVCANTLGSHYGSTSPLSIDPTTNRPYFHSFPLITNRDVAKTFQLLADHLELPKIHLLAGASLGGQQCLEWLIAEPERFEKSLLLATNAVHSPWGIAFNESQRLAIAADHTWQQDHPKAGMNGLKAARSIALLSYRTPKGYNTTQAEKEKKLDGFRASSYQEYQGEKLQKRFNAFSYWTLSKAMDSHNVGRNREGIERALSKISAKTHIVGIETDLLFPIEEQRLLHRYIANSKFYPVHSPLGHDGFLTEYQKVSKIIRKILVKKEKSIGVANN